MTKKGSAIEAFPQLKEILDRTDTLLTLRIMPNLFDLFLQKLHYRQEWLKGEFDFEASWRFSLFEETMLQYVRARAGAPGGHPDRRSRRFRVRRQPGCRPGIRGLFGRRGAMTWGRMNFGITASCSAWIEVEYSVPYVKCSGWKSSVEWRTISKTYRMPRQMISLGLSGEYAFRLSGGVAVGAKVAVHFSRRICGQLLSISPEIVINDGVLKDVRNQVRHFEAKLDRIAAMRAVGQRLRLSRARLERLLVPAKPETEEWLVVGSNDRWTVIPSYCTPWFTPRLTRVDGNGVTWDNALGYRFQDQVTCIEFTGGKLVPAWDHAHWGGTPQRPEEATGHLPDLYRLNAMFAESATVADDAQQESAQESERVPLTEQNFDLVVDHRPLQRLRDALTDDDRLSLPPDVYPFSYRPLSDPPFEKLQRELAQRRGGLDHLEDGVTRWRRREGRFSACCSLNWSRDNRASSASPAAMFPFPMSSRRSFRANTSRAR